MRGKLIKGVGLALIAMPEPFTTPLGVGLLAASWAISHHRNAQQRTHLRHMLGEYLNTYRPFGYGMDFVPKTSASLPYRDKEPLYKTKPSSSITFAKISSYNLRSEPKVVFHAFNSGLISKRFDNGGTHRGFEGYWGRKTKLDIDKVTYHNFRLVPATLS